MTQIQNKSIVFFITIALVSAIVIGSSNFETALAQGSNNTMTGNSQNHTGDEFKSLIAGPDEPSNNATIPLGYSVAQAIREDVTISLANASMIAEKEIGPNSHTEEARIGIWNDGTMVYFTLVIDSNDHIHGVVVNAEDGTVIEKNRITGENSFFLLLL